MKRLSTAILAFGIALVFVAYMVTYTVAYNQIAIVTTFGSATEPVQAELDEGKDSGSVIQEPGLKFKWPWPVQRVKTYPTQYQILQDTPEQLQLSDGNTLIVNLTLTWRISDPLAFDKAHKDMDDAEEKLLAQMSDLRSVISSNYSFAELVNEDASKVKLDELEQKIADEFSDRLINDKLEWGIEVSQVTLGKMLYAATTAASVNALMTDTQKGKADYIREQGQAQAAAIVAEAESIRENLKGFADTVASEIEVLGRVEANAILSEYAKEGASEDLAIFLRQLEAIEKILANRTTFVLNAKTFMPLPVLIYGPGEPGNLSRLFDNEQPDDLSTLAPLSNEAREQVMLGRIQKLRDRIAELEAELEAQQTAQPPLKTISQSEARP